MKEGGDSFDWQPNTPADPDGRLWGNKIIEAPQNPLGSMKINGQPLSTEIESCWAELEWALLCVLWQREINRLTRYWT